MFYFIVTIILLSYIAIFLNTISKHVYYVNSSICNFRELRYRIVMDMSQQLIDHETIQNEKDCLQILKIVDKNIQHFGSVTYRYTTLDFLRKSSYFSLKQIVKDIFYYSSNLNKFKDNQTKDLQSYVQQYNEGVRLLFEAIPLLKIRLVFWFAKKILPIVVKIGWNKLTKKLNYLIRLEKIERTVFGDYCM